MATNHYRGTDSPLLQHRTENYSPASGYRTEFEWRGMSETRARALANTYAVFGAEYSFTVAHGISTLVVSDPRAFGGGGTGGSTTADTIDVWEIGAMEVLISSFKNPRNENKLLTLDVHDKEAFRAAVDNPMDIGWDRLAAVLHNKNAADQIRIKRAYERFIEGSDSYFAWQYVVRHTTNVSNRYIYNIADNNIGAIYSPAQFYTEVQNPGYWLFPMPQAYINVLTSNPAPRIPDNFHLWGYLKSGSHRTTAAGNRINIVTEYKQFMWSTDEYATAT